MSSGLTSGRDTSRVKAEILSALAHPEAEEGLYFWNLGHARDSDERPVVQANDEEIYSALLELLRDGQVTMESGIEEVVFRRA